MSSTQDASMEAGQTVSKETKVAVTADDLDMEIENSSSGEKGHEDEQLIDYNEESSSNEDPIPALKRRANGQEAVFPNDRETKENCFKRKARAKRICAKNRTYG